MSDIHYVVETSDDVGKTWQLHGKSESRRIAIELYERLAKTGHSVRFSAVSLLLVHYSS